MKQHIGNEPVAWMNDSTPSGIFAQHIEGAKNFCCTIPLYANPPQREWVGLTHDEIIDCLDELYKTDVNYDGFYNLIEAKLKKKNA